MYSFQYFFHLSKSCTSLSKFFRGLSAKHGVSTEVNLGNLGIKSSAEAGPRPSSSETAASMAAAVAEAEA